MFSRLTQKRKEVKEARAKTEELRTWTTDAAYRPTYKKTRRVPHAAQDPTNESMTYLTYEERIVPARHVSAPPLVGTRNDFIEQEPEVQRRASYGATLRTKKWSHLIEPPASPAERGVVAQLKRRLTTFRKNTTASIGPEGETRTVLRKQASIRNIGPVQDDASEDRAQDIHSTSSLAPLYTFPTTSNSVRQKTVHARMKVEQELREMESFHADFVMRDPDCISSHSNDVASASNDNGLLDPSGPKSPYLHENSPLQTPQTSSSSWPLRAQSSMNSLPQSDKTAPIIEIGRKGLNIPYPDPVKAIRRKPVLLRITPTTIDNVSEKKHSPMASRHDSVQDPLTTRGVGSSPLAEVRPSEAARLRYQTSQSRMADQPRVIVALAPQSIGRVH
jgi:hypothetical protein